MTSWYMRVSVMYKRITEAEFYTRPQAFRCQNGQTTLDMRKDRRESWVKWQLVILGMASLHVFRAFCYIRGSSLWTNRFSQLAFSYTRQSLHLLRISLQSMAKMVSWRCYFLQIAPPKDVWSLYNPKIQRYRLVNYRFSHSFWIGVNLSPRICQDCHPK